MKEILFQPVLAERNGEGEFGSHLLHVPTLLNWVKAKHLHLKTEPPIEGFEFAQVEALLCAIERPFAALTPEQARELVAADPELRDDRAAAVSPAWLLGATAHLKWRQTITAATEAGALVLLDFASKMPVGAAKPAASVADESPTERDERMLANRERWMGSGRLGKAWDQKHMEQTGIGEHEVKRRLDAARKRRKANRPGPASPFAGLGDR